jgi:hypothetical protein
MLAGVISCKHNPVVPPGSDTTKKCDTCNVDTNHHPCDTCGHDTTHHLPPGPNDSTSHKFTWTQVTLPNEGILTGCWVFGPKNIYAVGGAVWKWDGATWNDVSPRLTQGSLSGHLSGFSMFAFSETDYWLVHGGVLYHETTGSPDYYVLQNANLHSVWGTSSSDMYAVGDGGTILHFDGQAWTKMASGTTKNLYSIWGTDDKNIWAAGFYSTTAETGLVHYDGISWQSIEPRTVGNIGPGSDGIQAVWTCDSAGVPVTILSGSSVWRESNAGGWRSDKGKVPNDLNGGGNIGLYELQGNSANDIIAAGGWGWVGHWNGRSWLKYDALFDLSNGSYTPGGLSIKDNTACVVGIKNGASWIAIGQR